MNVNGSRSRAFCLVTYNPGQYNGCVVEWLGREMVLGDECLKVYDAPVLVFTLHRDIYPALESCTRTSLS